MNLMSPLTGAPTMTKPSTHDETVNLDCALQTITHVIATVTGHIAIEKAKLLPDLHYLVELDRMNAELALERASLSRTDHVDIARILAVYGRVGLSGARTNYRLKSFRT
jgi:hypothetical protein